MTLLAPLGLLAGLLAIPVVAMHVLRPHRERTPVTSTYLWREAQEPVAAVQPWQRLRWSWPLVLQLLLVAMLALALARPAWPVTTSLADHTVFIVDASASMSATDERPDRLEAAKDRVRELWDELPDGAIASLVVADATPSVVVAETSDRGAFERELDRIRPTSGVADFDAAFTLAESLVVPDRPTGWILVGDGGLSDDEQRLAPPGMQFEAVGDGDVNRAITALSVTALDGELAAVVTVANTGGPVAAPVVRVDVDGVTVDRRELELFPGEVAEFEVAIPPGSRIEAFLDGDDLQLVDNARAALAPLADDVQVRIESDGPSFFVREALEAMGVDVVATAADDVDLVIYDGVDVPADPTVPFISINAPTPPLGLTVAGTVERPIPTFVADDALLDGVDITRTAIAQAQSLQVDAGEVLIGSAEGEPLVVAGRSGDVRWYHVAFRLEESNLPVSVAYPILFTRMVTGLTIADDVPATVETGNRLPSRAVASTVTSPRGISYDVAAGGRMPVIDRTGFWTVEDADGGFQPVAAVYPAGEMDLAVPDTLEFVPPPAETAAGPELSETLRSMLPWVIAAALAVLVVETLVSRRTIGVPRWQRRGAAALRGAIGLALVFALLDVGITRADDQVRAVLVVDRSDSLRADGRAEVDRLVAEVLSGAGSGQVAIVEIGRSAQVTAPFGSGDDITRDDPDPDGTDLVRGLRLASSLLDGSSRERIVVVSDGRDTTGGLNDELARLAEIGLPFDAIPVSPASVADVAVVAVSAPSTVSEDETFRVTADVVATEPTAVAVELVRNDVVEQRRDVDLVAGDNEVAFEVTSAGARLDRFEVRIADAIDAVPQNDAAQTAVSTEGPPRVLVLDGDGDGARIVAALTDRAIETVQRPVAEFPPADELNAYTSIVLVDTDIAELGAERVTALDGFVRDRGGGLVVVGGTDSYALGGYADTAFEDLLPVESRAEDPTRKASVAEVLLIDASESMGACHCAPVEGSDDPFAGEMIDGGVNKTDISRAAAARAAAALSDTDQLGVLAFNGSTDWVVPIQDVGSLGDVEDQLASLRPFGETHIRQGMEEAADGLRVSDRELKHIILFSDGFTPELVDPEFMGGGPQPTEHLAEYAEELAAEGITVSVVATGEGAAPLLEDIAIRGGGRFYPGRDLEEIPEIFVEEARIASRSFINEGVFPPTVTSTAAPVRTLAEAPPVVGYVATTPKPTTDVMLQVGEFADPLLASWRVGLGRVTTWASDAGDRWAADWAGWEGWADFWSNVVRDTFPLEGADGHELRTRFDGETLRLDLASDAPWPAGTRPIATVSNPDGTTVDVELQRVDEAHFSAVVPASSTGSYAVAVGSAQDGDADASAPIASSVASRSYPIEYRPPTGPAPDLAAMSQATGGRGVITAAQVFDPDDLASGSSTWRPQRWLLWFAAVAWPIEIALRRVQFSLLRDEIRARREHGPRTRRAAPPSPWSPPPTTPG